MSDAQNEVIDIDDDDNGLFSTPVYSKAANECHGQKILYCTAGEAMGVALQRWA
jgi:hypothetical protein